MAIDWWKIHTFIVHRSAARSRKPTTRVEIPKEPLAKINRSLFSFAFGDIELQINQFSSTWTIDCCKFHGSITNRSAARWLKRTRRVRRWRRIGRTVHEKIASSWVFRPVGSNDSLSDSPTSWLSTGENFTLLSFTDRPLGVENRPPRRPFRLIYGTNIPAGFALIRCGMDLLSPSLPFLSNELQNVRRKHRNGPLQVTGIGDRDAIWRPQIRQKLTLSHLGGCTCFIPGPRWGKNIKWRRRRWKGPNENHVVNESREC